MLSALFCSAQLKERGETEEDTQWKNFTCNVFLFLPAQVLGFWRLSGQSGIQLLLGKLPGSSRRKTYSHTSTSTVWKSVLCIQEDFFHSALGTCRCRLQVPHHSSQPWWGLCWIRSGERNGDHDTSSATQCLSAWCCSPGWCAFVMVGIAAFPLKPYLLRPHPWPEPHSPKGDFQLQAFKSRDAGGKCFWHSGLQVESISPQNQPAPQPCGHTYDGCMHP